MKKKFYIETSGNISQNRIYNILDYTAGSRIKVKDINYCKDKSILEIKINKIYRNISVYCNMSKLNRFKNMIIPDPKLQFSINSIIIFKNVSEFHLEFFPKGKVASNEEFIYFEYPILMKKSNSFEWEGYWGDRYMMILKFGVEYFHVVFQDVYDD